MPNKVYQGRIQHKHAPEADWLKATGFSPLKGELIVYDPDATHTGPRFKVGDGTTNVNQLPFVFHAEAQNMVNNAVAGKPDLSVAEMDALMALLN